MKTIKSISIQDQTCTLCGCLVHRTGDYGQPTVKGKSHASLHHFVAERFFGRSANRPGELRDAYPLSEAYQQHEGRTGVFCYECHEELLHNPIILPDDLSLLHQLFVTRGLTEIQKSEDRTKAAGRVSLLHEIIRRGLESINNQKS